MPDDTSIMQEKRGALELAGARLLVIKGPDRGRAQRLDRDEVIIGSGQPAHLQLTDTAVSRLHATVTATVEGLVLADAGSTNGTWIDGHRVKAAYLRFGDVVELGRTRIRVEQSPRAVDLALSAQPHFGELIGRSVAARRLFALLEAVAPEDTTVLLVGDTGVGKDACAEGIHAASPRADKPFVVVDCGAIAEGLFEAELFGYVRGAFTGAEQSRSGAFAEADGGTLFIDEIGELPRALQPKLLRAIETREIRPVGGTRPVHVDVRIIAATNRDLKREVNLGAFREDLFYRLNVVTIRVPPLGERMEDIPLLATRFWRRFSGDPNGECPPELLGQLVSRPWPGNVRELQNRIEQAVLLDHSQVSAAAGDDDLPSYREAKRDAVNTFEQLYLTALLKRARGSVAEAARLASMDRIYLSRLLRRQKIKPQR